MDKCIILFVLMLVPCSTMSQDYIIKLKSAKTTITITSPNYPKNYNNNVDILWQVIAPTGFRVMVQFTDFDLEPQGTDGAYYDSLRVYQALTNSFNGATQIARLPGSSLPDNFSSVGSYLWIRFISDGSQSKKGFSLSIRAVEPVGTSLSLVPILSSTLASLSAIAIIVLFVWLVCRRKRLKHVSSQRNAAFVEPGGSHVMRDNATFESSNVHDRMSDDADHQCGNDPYMALTTPHGGPTLQVYQTLSKVNSQGDGYEVPVNGANGSEFQIRPETDYETHEYQESDIVGRNIPQYESHINVLQEMSKTDAETPHEYENMSV